MAKVVFLRPSDMDVSLKHHYVEANELLNRSRAVMEEVDQLELEYIELLKVDGDALKERGFSDYYRSPEREAFLQASKDNLDRRYALLDSMQSLRKKAREKLDWIKATFG